MATVKRIISPEDWKNRQITNIKAVGRSSYLIGIKSPKADPIKEGIDAEDKYAAETRKAIDAKSRMHALEKTDMGEWYKYAAEIGADKLVDGVVKREAKVDDFVKTFQPMLGSLLSRVDALADVTDSDREQKMLENLRGLKALKGKA